MSIRRETCYVIDCDDCRAVFDENGDSIFHFTSPEAAETSATETGWIITPDGRHLCARCWATYACTTFGHAYSIWEPCACRGALPSHSITGCGFYRYCTRQGCDHEQEATLATLPTTDEPHRSR